MTSDYDNNSEQSVEIDTVAKSLPHFYLIRRTACKQKDYKILPKLHKISGISADLLEINATGFDN